jgi:hypothetical protein
VAISGVFINISLVISIFLIIFYEAFGNWLIPYIVKNDHNNSKDSFEENLEGKTKINFEKVSVVEMSEI